MKIRATTANAVGLAVLALGTARPLIDDGVPITWKIGFFGLVALAGHLAANYVVGRLETDE